MLASVAEVCQYVMIRLPGLSVCLDNIPAAVVLIQPSQGVFGKAMAYTDDNPPLAFADLFCGIGGFHVAAARLGMRCVFACDIDAAARRAYRRNFGIEPAGDITRFEPASVPDHDVLLAGFPCQPFSIIGAMRGFADARGTLFFNLAAVLAAREPPAFVLENVRQLSTHNRGRTMDAIIARLNDLGYRADWKVLNALDFGLPKNASAR